MNKKLLFLSLIFYLPGIYASSFVWNGSSDSNWGNSLNWTPNGVPGLLDTVQIDANGNAPILSANMLVSRIIMTGGTINLNTYSLLTLKSAIFNGGIISNGSLTLGGDTVIFSGTTFNCSINAVVADVYFDGSVFNNPISVEKTGSSNNNSSGGNTFNGKAEIKHSGSSGWLLMAYNSGDIFNDTAIFNCTGSGYIYPGYDDSTAFNEHVYISSTGSSQGIRFGIIGKVSLAANKNLYTDASGFSSGYLILSHFYFKGNQNFTLNLSGTASLEIKYANFNGAVNITTPNIEVRESVFNDVAYFKKTGDDWDNWYGGNTFNKKLTVVNAGTFGLKLGHALGDIFNDTSLFYANTYTIYISQNGVSYFNSDVYLNSNGSGGIAMGYDTGKSIIASGYKIMIGDSGYSNGTLRIGGIQQTDAQPLNFTLTGSGKLVLDSANIFKGKITAIAPSIILGNSTYYEACYFKKTGADYDVGRGGNIFNKKVAYINDGANVLRLTSTFGDIYNDSITLTNTGTSYIQIAYGDTTTLNNPVVVESNNGSGVHFGSGGGYTYLKNNAKISFGSLGYTSGNFILQYIIQENSTPFNFSIPNTVANKLYLKYSTLNGKVTIDVPSFYFVNNTFNNSVSATKNNGTDNNFSNGDNTFNDTLTLINNSTAIIRMASSIRDIYNGIFKCVNNSTGIIDVAYTDNGNPSLFNDHIILSATGNGNIRFGYSGGSSQMAAGKNITIGSEGFTEGNLSLNNFTHLGNVLTSLNISGSGYFYTNNCTFNNKLLVQAPAISLKLSTFNDSCSYTQTGSSNQLHYGGNIFNAPFSLINTGSGNLKMGNLSADTINNKLYINNNGNGNIYLAYGSQDNIFNDDVSINIDSTGHIYFAYSSGTGVIFNGNIKVSGDNTGIILISTYGSSGMASGYSFITLPKGFKKSSLRIANFTQNGSTAQTLAFTDDSYLFIDGNTTFNGKVNFTVPNIYLTNSVFNDTSVFIKTGSSNNYNYGQSIFNKRVTFNNSGSGILRLANSIEDTYNEEAIFTSTGSSYIDVAYTGANIFKNNIYVNSTGSSQGIKFGQGQGTSSLAVGKNISVGTDGFLAGSLNLQYFSQNDINTPQVITMGNSSSIYFEEGTVFSGTLSVSSGNIYSELTTFNNIVDFTKTGTSDSYSNGNNSFEKNITFTNSGSGNWRLASTYANTYDSSATYINTGSGSIEPAYTGTTTFGKNITITSNKPIYFGQGGGTVSLNSSSSQNILGDTTINFYHLSIGTGSSEVTLYTPVRLSSISSLLSLGDRKLNLNSNELTIENSSTSAFSYSSGYIVSETSNNAGKINWNIGSTSGQHIYPFGKSDGTLIPFKFSVTTGDVGYVSIATYPTASNNTPFPISPVSVANISGSGNTDNSSNVINRFWQIDQTGTNAKATLVFTYASGEEPINGDGDLIAQRYDQAKVEWMNEFSGQSNDPAANTVTVSNVDKFSPWTLAKSSNPLPVELLFFTAEAKNDFVQLNWATASEINNSHFSIERSMDGIVFESILEISGNGTTNQPQYYEAVDSKPHNGINYYRIKQIDYNGDFEYTKIVTVHFNFEGEKRGVTNVYFSENNLIIRYHISGNTNLNMAIYNLNGQLIEQVNFIPDTSSNQKVISLNKHFPAHSFYFISCLYDNNEFTQKVLKN